MPRLLIVNSADVIRKTTDMLARGLADRGYEVRVVTPAHEKTAGYFDDDDAITLLPYESWFVPKIRYSVPLFDFLDVVRREVRTADVVVITSAVYLPSLVGTIVAARSDTPNIVTIDALVGINWSYGNRLVDALGKGFVLTLSRLAFATADAVVGLTENLTPHLPELVDESKIRIIPNGIDTSTFAPAEPRDGGMEDPVRLLFVGRLSKVKGIEYLLSAFEALSQDARSYRLTMVGDGEDRDRYVDLARDLGVADGITWTGWVDDVRPYYHDADIVVLPSISEGQPSVPLEAQACGVPVVATDVGGVAGLVEAGRVVPPREPERIRAAIAELSREDPTELGERARQFVVDNYSRESMIERYQTLFETISNR